MDNSIIRWYNKNRKTIWTYVLIIAAVIGLIQALDKYYENKSKETVDNQGEYIYKNNYSVVSQQEIEDEISEKSNDLIADFFRCCNNKEIENAYNLLSTECKQELYPTIEDFEVKYYNRVFKEYKNYNATLWITNSNINVYRIEIMADLLASGQKDDMPIVDYYTVINENEGQKLNISSYIGKEIINISNSSNNVFVNVVSKKNYIDYEKYEIEIQNNSGNKVIFNNKQNTGSIYIKDENDLKYIAFLNEISSSELEIMNGSKRTLEIKINRGYKPQIDIEEIVFENIIINGKQDIITIGI